MFNIYENINKVKFDNNSIDVIEYFIQLIKFFKK